MFPTIVLPFQLLLKLQNLKVLRCLDPLSRFNQGEADLNSLFRDAPYNSLGVLDIAQARSSLSFRQNIAAELGAYQAKGTTPKFTFDDGFEEVLNLCGNFAGLAHRFDFSQASKNKFLPFLSNPLRAAYQDLHSYGEAHCVSVRFGTSDIAAGAFGVRIGNVMLVQSRFTKLPDVGANLPADSRFSTATNFGHLADYLMMAYAYGIGCTQVVGTMFPNSITTRRGGAVLKREDQLTFDIIPEILEKSLVYTRTYGAMRRLLGTRAALPAYCPQLGQKEAIQLKNPATSPSPVQADALTRGATSEPVAAASGVTARRRRGLQPFGTIFAQAYVAAAETGTKGDSHSTRIGAALRRVAKMRRAGLG
jgi:hypothetical protein